MQPGNSMRMRITVNVSNLNVTIINMQYPHSSWLEFLDYVGLWCQELPGVLEGVNRVESTLEASLAGMRLTRIALTVKWWQEGAVLRGALRTANQQGGTPERMSLQYPWRMKLERAEWPSQCSDLISKSITLTRRSPCRFECTIEGKPVLLSTHCR